MNFKRIAGGLPVAPVLAALADAPWLWELHTIRQEFFCSPHWATQSIYLRGPREFTFDNYFMTTDAIDMPTGDGDRITFALFNAVAKVVMPVYRELRAHELGRVLIVNLPAGASLIEHVDEGVYADHYERVHVPLVTNEGAVLVCNDEAKHIPAGEAWWFDHRAPHTARNAGGSDRLHLIVDLVADGLRESGPERDDARREARAS